jgi:hypothetical protein
VTCLLLRASADPSETQIFIVLDNRMDSWDRSDPLPALTALVPCQPWHSRGWKKQAEGRHVVLDVAPAGLLSVLPKALELIKQVRFVVVAHVTAHMCSTAAAYAKAWSATSR